MTSVHQLDPNIEAKRHVVDELREQLRRAEAGEDRAGRTKEEEPANGGGSEEALADAPKAAAGTVLSDDVGT